jgi:hypothetical protein
MRLKEWGFVLVLVATSACQRNDSGAGLARCGGSDPVSGFHNVAVGADTDFYTARSRQVLKIKPAVEVTTNTDAKGYVTGLTMVARDNKVNINCACPAGCKGGTPPGCFIDFDPGPGGDATCSGDCVTENSCCFGCGWQAP